VETGDLEKSLTGTNARYQINLAVLQNTQWVIPYCPLSRFPGDLTTLHLAGDWWGNQVAGHAV